MSRFVRFLILSIAFSALLISDAVAAPIRVAGTDIGSKGIRAVVVEFDPDVPNGPVKLLYSSSINPNLGALRDGMFLPERIAEAGDNIADIVEVFTKIYDVKPERIKLVGSSSLATVPNRDVLVKAVAEKTGLTMTFLKNRTEETELEVAGLTLLGKPTRGVVITVGNGNSGVGAEGSATKFEIPFGTGTLADKATEVEKAKKLSFTEAVATVRDSDLLPVIQAAAKNNPSLVGQTPVTVIGGIAFATAVVVHPEKAADAKVELTLDDFRKLIELLGKEEITLPTPNLETLPEAVRKKAEADLRTVRDNFPAKSLFAGATLVIAVGESLKLEGKPLVFLRNAQYAWIVGYLAPKRVIPPQKKIEPETPETVKVPKPAENIIVEQKPPPEPLAMGVPYRVTPGGYIPLEAPRPYGYFAPYTAPYVTGRYSWDYNGAYGFSMYGYSASRPVYQWSNPYFLAPNYGAIYPR
ncbi:MAG: hypothetical protein K8U57_20230 [Planctomycetes bacterium]|nr:hypothetical protein [Planctomycetota bacterium]